MKYYNKNDLILRLKETTLKGDVKVKPYLNASIDLATLSFENIFPTAFYYFSEHVNKLRETKKMLEQNSLDIFNLNGYVEFEINKQLMTLTPPIIEVVDNKMLLIDGIHRVILNHQLNEKGIQCVIIKGASPLTYAIENPNGWKDVVEFESEIPEGFKTRNKRYPNEIYKYFGRVFNFNGVVQLPRKHHIKTVNDIIKDKILKSR